MAASNSVLVYAQCTVLWGCVLLCDYMLTKQMKGSSSAKNEEPNDDKTDEHAEKKTDNVKDEQDVPYGQKLFMSLFGKGTKELTYCGSRYEMYTLSNIAFGVLIWMLGEALGNYNMDGSLNRNLVNIQAPFHFLVALSSVYLDGFDIALNPIKRHPEIPIYNILSILMTVLWFAIIALENLKPVPNNVETATTAAEISALYILDFLVQPFWTGAYIMTSFLPIGLLNAYLAVTFLIGCPAYHANVLRELAKFPPSMTTSLATVIAGVLGLAAIPMAALFIQPRLFECFAQLKTIVDDTREEMKKNPKMIEELIQSVIDQIPDEIKSFSEKMQIPQELKYLKLGVSAQKRKKQVKTE